MPVDLSPDAIDRRLRQVAQLRSLCLSLAESQAGLPGPKLSFTREPAHPAPATPPRRHDPDVPE